MLASWQALPAQLGEIFYFVVLPVLAMAGVGALLQKTLSLDIQTLSRLNFYFIMPAIVYFSVVTTRLQASDVGAIMGFTLAVLACMWALSYGLGRAIGLPRGVRSVLVLSTIMHNSGNFGLPLQRLAFEPTGQADAAVSMQAFVMITQNVFTFTIGILIAAGGKSRTTIRENLAHMLRFPPVYALAAALITVQIRGMLGDSAPAVADALEPLWRVVLYSKNAFIGIALLTLGAKLATVPRGGRAKYPVHLSVLLRLVVGPAAALGLIHLLGIRGFRGQFLLIAMASPTAVNCMLMCLEFRNHPDYAAKAVFYSTLLSPLTVTAVIYLARSGVVG